MVFPAAAEVRCFLLTFTLTWLFSWKGLSRKLPISRMETLGTTSLQQPTCSFHLGKKKDNIPKTKQIPRSQLVTIPIAVLSIGLRPGHLQEGFGPLGTFVFVESPHRSQESFFPPWDHLPRPSAPLGCGKEELL